MKKITEIYTQYLPSKFYAVGLLSCMTGLRQKTLLDGNDLFSEFKGSLTE